MNAIAEVLFTETFAYSVLLLIILLFGLDKIWRAQRDIRKGQASLAWTATRGRVISAQIDVTRSVDASDAGDGFVNVDTHRIPVVRYTYEVGEVVYTGDRVSLGGSPRSAETTIARYSPQTDVTVFYDPSAPEEAILEPGPSDSMDTVVDMLAGFFFAGVGIVGLISLWFQ